MNKVKKFIKSNIKLVIGLIIGAVVAGSGTYAAIAIQGTGVGYTDTYSIGATTVQEAIDKLYTKILVAEINVKCDGIKICVRPNTTWACITPGAQTDPANFGTSYGMYDFDTYNNTVFTATSYNNATNRITCVYHRAYSAYQCTDNDYKYKCTANSSSCSCETTS